MVVWWLKLFGFKKKIILWSDMTPYEKLKFLGYPIPEEFCLFPNLILDRLVNLPEILNRSKNTHYHLDYDHLSNKFVAKICG